MQIATRTPKYVFHKIKSMKKLNQWMTAAILFCGFQLFAACTASQDNPAEPVKPEVNQDRQAFEAEFSNSLQSVAEEMRFDAAKQAILSGIPQGHQGAPEDVANAVSFFAQDSSSYITGQVLAVDGGMTMA